MNRRARFVAGIGFGDLMFRERQEEDSMSRKHRRCCSWLGCLAGLWMSATVSPAAVVLTNGDAAGSSSFNTAGNWSDGLAPHAGADYVVAVQYLRTPQDANDYTFQGDSLTITNGGAIIFKGTAANNTYTINNLTLNNGGLLRAGTANSQSVTLRGALAIVGTNVASEIRSDQATYILNLPVSGNGNVLFSTASGHTTTLNGTNTFTGNITVTGSLIVGPTGNLKFLIGGSGTNNSVSGTGTLTVNGSFLFDLSGAATNVGSSWTIVNTSTRSFGGGFNVPGFTNLLSATGPGLWDLYTNSVYYEFNTASGVLSVLSQPSVLQSLSLSNGVQTFSVLTNTFVTMTGACELWITGTNNPIANSTINLNSTNAFFVMSNLRPSTVVASYLGQVQVFGAPAVADGNCRVVEYGMGTIVIPQSPSFQPLTVYTGPQFTGASTNLSQYVSYKTNLGPWYASIRSFKLKRGYMATFAQNENGSGRSRNYIAADGDIEVSVLPSSLDNNIRFVYVLPWRWTSKKGIAGNIGGPVNALWWYDWNIDQNSTRNMEYVAIRQNQYWPSLSQNWQSRGVNTVLGYNEPDSSSQANLSVSTAISAWPDLLATGLRVGSPATTDGGRTSWLYPFISQADSAGLRVDFVAVHYYWCYDPTNPSGAANQMYNFLLDVWNNTHRPIWITEWNNGANWTGCADPTYAQQQACIAAMLDMLDSTPFVERYALYNWVEDVRRVEWDDGSLTLAGQTYRDQYSPIGYRQTYPSSGTRSFTQLRFENNTLDTSGYGNNAIAAGSPAYAAGHTGQAIVFDGTNTALTLPQNVATSSSFSFAAWVYWNGGPPWQRIFDFGLDTTYDLYLTPRSGSNTLQFGIRNGGNTLRVDAPQLPSNQWTHVAVTLSGNTCQLYVNGTLLTTSNNVTIAPSSFAHLYNYLGKSQWPDPLFSGRMDEVLITDYALSAAQVAGLLTNTPPQFSTNLIAGGSATEAQPYNFSIAGLASDPDAGDTLTFSKIAGPAWVGVSSNGTLSGTPTSSDGGINYVTVRVTDAAGQNAFALVTISVTTITADGVWIADADGQWGESNRWSGNIVATGAGRTADFSAINITGNRTVTLDASRTIGNLKFADTSGSQTWTITNSADSVLTLDTGSAAQPSILVSNTVTLALPLGGNNGFVKSGPGMLILAGDNTLSGPFNLDRGIDGNNNDGVTRIASPNAAAGATSINIRNTSVSTAGGATLQLDGSAGDIVIEQDLSVTCRNNSSTPTIQNLAGTNTLAGFIRLDVGGNMFNLQSDAGLLIFSGINQYLGGLTAGRIYNFTGAGDFLLIGPILNSTNGAPISLTKSGSGALTLAGDNTYAAGTTVNGGTLLVNGSITGTVTVAGGATLGGAGTINGSVTIANGATLSPGSSAGTLTVNGNLALNNTTTLAYELGATSDRTVVNGNLTLDGVLNVSDAGGFGPGNYTLFAYTGALTDNGLALGTLPGGYNYAVVAGGGAVVLQVTSPLSPFAAWQMQYFGSTNCATCGGDADFDGDGMSNTNEFLGGTNPTNSASAFRITRLEAVGNDLVVTWQGGTGSTGVVQAVDGTYATNFADISGPVVIPGGGLTNYLDAGALTNPAPRFYRVRLVP